MAHFLLSLPISVLLGGRTVDGSKARLCEKALVIASQDMKGATKPVLSLLSSYIEIR